MGGSKQQTGRIVMTRQQEKILETLIYFLETGDVLCKRVLERDLIRLNVVLNLMRGQKQSLEFTVKRFGEG